MDIEHDTDSGIVRIRIAEEPTIHDRTLLEHIDPLLSGMDVRVVIDLSLIRILHSPAIANLIHAYLHLKKRGIQLALAACSGINRKVLSCTQLDQLFDIVEDENAPASA